MMRGYYTDIFYAVNIYQYLLVEGLDSSVSYNPSIASYLTYLLHMTCYSLFS